MTIDIVHQDLTFMPGPAPGIFLKLHMDNAKIE